jgi:hypothetical protein
MKDHFIVEKKKKKIKQTKKHEYCRENKVLANSDYNIKKEITPHI